MSKSTLSDAFFRIINALCEISETIIKWPTPAERNVSKGKFKIKSKLDNIVGAIDGTFIPMKAPKDQVRAYTNRKSYTSVTLQAICDHEMKFIDCFIGYPSSVGDARIFKNSDIYEDIVNSPSDFFDINECILRDKAYPVTSWCIPPFINRHRLTESQILFNSIHASLRSVIERAFALLFGRFRRLRFLDMNLLECIPATVLAACVLHNIALKFDGPFENYIQEGIEHVVGNIDEEPQNPVTQQQRVLSELLGKDLRDRMVEKLCNSRRRTTLNMNV